MTDLTTIADRLYGSTENTPSEATQAPEQTAQTVAQPVTESVTENAQPAQTPAATDFVTAIPEDIRKQREADTARLFYSPQVTLKDAIPDSAFENIEGFAPETAKAVASEFREMAADLGISTKEDVQLIAKAMSDAQANPTTDTGKAADEVIELLNKNFGNDAAQALRDARKFITADPRREALFASIGNNPQVVLKVAQLARASKGRGQL